MAREAISDFIPLQTGEGHHGKDHFTLEHLESLNGYLISLQILSKSERPLESIKRLQSYWLRKCEELGVANMAAKLREYNDQIVNGLKGD